MKTRTKMNNYKQVQEYPQEIIDCIDEQFPKGDKNRGKALVLQAVAYTFGRQNLKKEFLKEIEKFETGRITLNEMIKELKSAVEGKK